MGMQSRTRAARSALRVIHKKVGVNAANELAESMAVNHRVPDRALRRTLRELLTGHRSIQTVAFRWFASERRQGRRPEGWNVGEVLTWAHKVYQETGVRV